MKTIGILGGMGPEATISYYACITRTYYQRYGDYAYPQIIIYSLSSQDIIGGLSLSRQKSVDAVGDESEVSARVKNAIEKLHLAGADFVIAACNTVHVVFDEVAKDIPIPWISIMDVTAESIKKARLNKVGLLGSVLTMTEGFYEKALVGHGIECLTPGPEDRERINDIIFSELVVGQVKKDSRLFIVDCIEKLAKRGAEGIVLACAELPFLIRPNDIKLPLFNTVNLHARKALDLAVNADRP